MEAEVAKISADGEHITTLQQGTVRLRHEGKLLGTGFFVGSDLIVTCAHVVEVSGKALPSVVVEYGTETLTSNLLRSETSDQQAGILFPDIAVLEWSGHPGTALILEESFASSDELYAWGFPSEAPNGDSILGTCEGIRRFGEKDSQELIKFRTTRVTAGFSGAPVLNLRTGRVCGMIKRTRDESTDAGGFAVRAAMLLHLDEIDQQQRPLRELVPPIKVKAEVSPAPHRFNWRDALYILRANFRRMVTFGLSILFVMAICALANDYVRNALWGHNREWTANFDKERDPWVFSGNFRPERERLIVPASNWAAPRRWDKTPLDDFLLHFRLAFSQVDTTPGLKAEWVLRSKFPQESSPPLNLSDVVGYHFQLIKKDDGALTIRGFVVREPGKSEPLDNQNGGHSLGMSVCCDRDGYLLINVIFIGKRIIHCRVLQSYSTTPASNEVGADFWDAGFIDSRGTIARGGLVLAAGINAGVYSEIAVSPPPLHDLRRCFFSARFCLPSEAPPCA